MSITMQLCGRCEVHYFPPRQMCPDCGGTVFTPASAATGVVERTTVLTSGIILGSVISDLGPVLITRLHAGVDLGDVVDLVPNPEISAGQAFVPYPETPVEEGLAVDR